jgi:hypothetical protein
MERDRLSELNAYQSIALSVLVSAVTALAVLFAFRLRRRYATSPEPASDGKTLQIQPDLTVPPWTAPPQDVAEELAPRSAGTTQTSRARHKNADGPVQPVADPAQSSDVPSHFSEDLIIPGLTHTGQEILEQDLQQGRSPDGV